MSPPRLYTDEERKARKAAGQKRRREANRDRVLEIERATRLKRVTEQAAWRDAHREESRAYFKERYQELKAAGHFQTPVVKAKRRVYYEANRARIAALHAAYKKANPHKVKLDGHRRRARIKGNGGELSTNILQKLMALQKGRCANCRCRLTRPELDHIEPISRGGLNVDSNVQLLCGKCNRRKHSKDPIVWANENGRLL